MGIIKIYQIIADSRKKKKKLREHYINACSIYDFEMSRFFSN